MLRSCRVEGCRFPQYHITAGHKCGRCRRYGHGQIECLDEQKKMNLTEASRFDHLRPSEYCDVVGCYSRHNHKYQSHTCENCRKNIGECTCGNCHRAEDILFIQRHIQREEEEKREKELSRILCPFCRQDNSITSSHDIRVYGIEERCHICCENDISIVLPECRHAMCMECYIELSRTVIYRPDPSENAEMTARPYLADFDNVYVTVYAGQGCIVFVRKKEGRISSFFLHGDMMGQYGVDDTPRADAFVDGLEEILSGHNLTVAHL